MHIPIDYPTLRVIWWLLLGVLLTGFAIMDGFDLGIGIMLHRVARTEGERRVALNSIGPVWEGNQIWLVLGAGAIFAAWPDIYAVSFSGFYFAMLLVLVALILRPVGFKYRGKIDHPTWRAVWDMCLFVAGFVPALIFGVAVGNVLQGVPFHYNEVLLPIYTGHFLALLNPFALLTGALSVSMLCMHGCIYLALKTEGAIRIRASKYSKTAAFITVILFAAAGIWVDTFLSGFVFSSTPAMSGASNPLHKTVILQTGAWLANYNTHPWSLVAPVAGFTGAILTMLLVRGKYYFSAWLASASSITGIIATVGVSMFPFILPSSTDPSMSLTVWDASSSQLTLFTMLIATVIFMPIILLYTSWVYHVMRGSITEKDILKNKSTYY